MAYAQTNIALYRQLMTGGWSPGDLARAAAAYDLAVQLFAGRMRASGKPFLAHLVGTASILARHGAEPDIVVAGLLHAAYAQGMWGDETQGAAPTRRSRVVRAVGAEVERLVHGYTALPWPTAEGSPALRFMRIANELEDHLDGAMAFADKAPTDPSSPRARLVVETAHKLGLANLADELVAAFADRPTIPDALKRRHTASYDALPPARAKARRWHRLLAAIRPVGSRS